MSRVAVVAGAMLTITVSTSSVEAQSRPGGCLKYGLGGAVAGHFAGGHRLKGALAGCAIGVLRRKQYEREVRERNQNRNRTAERRRYERDELNPSQRGERRTPERGPSAGERSPYEEFGLPPAREQARTPPGRTRNTERDGGPFESGGSFARRPLEDRGRARGKEPDETGGITRGSRWF
jgi:hypothetical protein